jgi:hypothetical protein
MSSSLKQRTRLKWLIGWSFLVSSRARLVYISMLSSSVFNLVVQLCGRKIGQPSNVFLDSVSCVHQKLRQHVQFVASQSSSSEMVPEGQSC